MIFIYNTGYRQPMPLAVSLPVLFIASANTPHQEQVKSWWQQQFPDLKDTAIQWLNEEGTGITIEQVRDLIQDLSYGASGLRTVVLLHFDTASEPAQQAMLKTLEEPPENTLLILTVPSAESVLPTIHSRCQLVEAAPTNVGTIPPEVIQLYEEIQSSSYGQIITLVEPFNDRDKAVEVVGELLRYLHQQQGRVEHLQALLRAHQQLNQNGNVKLVMEQLGFALKG